MLTRCPPSPHLENLQLVLRCDHSHYYDRAVLLSMAMAINRRTRLTVLLLLIVLLIVGLELTVTNGSIIQAAIDAQAKLAPVIGINSSSKKSHAEEDIARPTSHPLTGNFQLPASARPSQSHSDRPQYCKWEFSHYESSPYELQWFSMVGEAQHKICETVQIPEHAESSKKIVQTVLDQFSIDENIQWKVHDSILPSNLPSEFELFSRMHYSRSCYDESSRTYVKATGHGIQLIEPLWGMLRDPFDRHCADKRLNPSELKGWDDGNDHGQSKQHIIPQGFAPYYYDESVSVVEGAATESLSSLTPWRTHGVPPWFNSLIPKQDPKMGQIYTAPKNVHIDLGSAYFGAWDHLNEQKGMKNQVDVSVASSGRWFYDTYHKRGQTFDNFIAVEVEPLNTTRAFKMLPKDLVGKYNLMNIGLTMDDDDELNAIDIIKRLTRPEDFLVLKIDIDSAPIEIPMVNSLLNDDPKNGGASALVDELMFEHRKLPVYALMPRC